MLERQEESAVVTSIEAREHLGVHRASAAGDAPLLSTLVVHGADRLAEIFGIERSTQRRVFTEWGGHVLIIGQRIEAAVVRAGDGVLDGLRPLVHKELMIGE